MSRHLSFDERSIDRRCCFRQTQNPCFCVCQKQTHWFKIEKIGLAIGHLSFRRDAKILPCSRLSTFALKNKKSFADGIFFIRTGASRK